MRPKDGSPAPVSNTAELFRTHLPEASALYRQFINPSYATVLKLLGLDRPYARASGAWLMDAAGRRYLDFCSGYCAFNIGHNHPTVRRALRELLDEDCPTFAQLHLSPLAGLVARELVRRSPPSLDMVFFSNSGAEAVEAAIKFARASTGRPRILHASGSFHGLTTGALSLAGHAMWRDGFGALLPGCDQVEWNSLDALQRELSRRDVAAFIVEPIQAEGGVCVPDDHYLPEAQALCRHYGTLFALDEVQTGFGRTGKFLAAEHWGLEPDLLTLAKAMGGGQVPVAATLMRRSIYDRVYTGLDRCVVHSSTFGENNLAMAAALATLRVLDEERLVENAVTQGEFLVAELRALATRHRLIADVRGRGLMIGVEFREPPAAIQRLGWKLMHRVNGGLFGQSVVMPLLAEHGILSMVAGHDPDVLKVAPPLVITREEVERFTRALDAVLTRHETVPGSLWDVGVSLAKNALL